MSAFTTLQRVRFGHVDPAGIAYFPRIFDYVHEAFEDLWGLHVGRRYDHLVREDGLGFPLVHSEADFRHPLHFGDQLVVRISCFRLGRSSLGLRYVYELDQRVCVEARMTTVCVRLSDLASRPIPEPYRRKLEEIVEP